MKRDPVLIIMSVLAGLQTIVASADWTELVSEPVARGGNLVVAGLTVGLAFYLRGKVTPVNTPDKEKAELAYGQCRNDSVGGIVHLSSHQAFGG